MAGGILGFLGFGKKEKPNLTQNYQAPPAASSAPLYNELRNLASRRIQGQDLGFGEDFVDKSTNAQAKRMRQDYQDYTSPMLDSELSKRGVSRSAGPGLATDIKTRAIQTNQSDIDQLMERFFTLNEAQKKSDQTEGIKVGDQLNTQYLNQGNESARQFNAAEAGNTARTAGVAAVNNANSQARQNNTLQALGGFMGSGGLGNIGSLLSKAGLSSLGGAFSSMNDIGKSMGTSSVNLGDDDFSLLEQYLKKKGVI